MATRSPTAARGPSALCVSGLSASSGPGRALEGVELEVAGGELVVLTGEPGAGKTALVRALSGDLAPDVGEIALAGSPIPPDWRAASRLGIAVVWQDLALCDNLDIAANILLGRESFRRLLSSARFHAHAAALLAEMQIPIPDTRRLVGSLPAGQRQLVAIAAAVSRRPRLLILDEPSERLSVAEQGVAERLLRRLANQGTAILLVTRDLEQMFRLADRIVVLHGGVIVADLDPRGVHRDDVAALMAGREVDTTARRQLSRLHGLADRLVAADPSSSLTIILTAMRAALGAEKILIHVLSGDSLECAAALGVDPGPHGWSRLPVGAGGGPVGRAAASAELVVESELRARSSLAVAGDLADMDSVASSWSVPVSGPAGVSAVITILSEEPTPPDRDDLDLLALYAGYAASAVERDRLLHQVTARNRALETVREMLEAVSGPSTVEAGLPIALASLRNGLDAEEVALVTRLGGDGDRRTYAYAGARGTDPSAISAAMSAAGGKALSGVAEDGRVAVLGSDGRCHILAVPFNAPGGPCALVAMRAVVGLTEEEAALIENAAHSLRLALERQESERASQEAAALRRSRQLQRSFLSKLSHELRTPLTAIKGYASSLMAADVTWDPDSEQRFLERIEAESARLGRLVDDLLDFSAIESGVMRLQLDWCDLPLVVDAALACLPSEQRRAVSVSSEPGLPPVWADHDRLEQVFVNLLANALRHNPPGTRVQVSARALPGHHPLEAVQRLGDGGDATAVEITVVDDGTGFSPSQSSRPLDNGRRERSVGAGAGLGLLIARGIVDAHRGTMELVPSAAGTRVRIVLPVERPEQHDAGSDILQLIESQDSLVGSIAIPQE